MRFLNANIVVYFSGFWPSRESATQDIYPTIHATDSKMKMLLHLKKQMIYVCLNDNAIIDICFFKYFYSFEIKKKFKIKKI